MSDHNLLFEVQDATGAVGARVKIARRKAIIEYQPDAEGVERPVIVGYTTRTDAEMRALAMAEVKEPGQTLTVGEVAKTSRDEIAELKARLAALEARP